MCALMPLGICRNISNLTKCIGVSSSNKHVRRMRKQSFDYPDDLRSRLTFSEYRLREPLPCSAGMVDPRISRVFIEEILDPLCGLRSVHLVTLVCCNKFFYLLQIHECLSPTRLFQTVRHSSIACLSRLKDVRLRINCLPSKIHDTLKHEIYLGNQA